MVNSEMLIDFGLSDFQTTSYLKDLGWISRSVARCWLWISQHWHSHQIRHRYHRWYPLGITHGNFGNGKTIISRWSTYFNPISKWWFTNTWLDIHIIHFLDTWSVAQVTEHAVAVAEHRSDRAVDIFLSFSPSLHRCWCESSCRKNVGRPWLRHAVQNWGSHQICHV